MLVNVGLSSHWIGRNADARVEEHTALNGVININIVGVDAGCG